MFSPDESTTGLSCLRKSTGMRRTRASIVTQYSIDVNSENTLCSQEIDENEQNDALTFLMKRPLCQICRVSPLHNLHYDPVKLKQYALKIKQYLATNIKRNTSIVYTAEITILSGLKLEANHSDALKITVWGTESEENVKLLYSGVLMSWGNVEDRSEKRRAPTYLPLLLEHGNQRVTLAVRHILTKLFDCVIDPIIFTQSHLVLFSALLSSFRPKEGARHVVYTYQVPHTQLATTLNVQMELDDIHAFWKQCCTQSTVHNDVTSRKLYAIFQQHILEHHNVDVASLYLSKLSWPSLDLRASGHIRMMGVSSEARPTLRVLCQMAQILHTDTPTLGTC